MTCDALSSSDKLSDALIAEMQARELLNVERYLRRIGLIAEADSVAAIAAGLTAAADDVRVRVSNL